MSGGSDSMTCTIPTARRNAATLTPVGGQVGELFSNLSFKPISCLFLYLLDGHHLWETEAKVDRDASKSVSDACDDRYGYKSTLI